MCNQLSNRVVVEQVILLLALLGALPAAKAGGNDCPALLPADARPVGELRLCRPDAGTKSELTACRDYGTTNRVFRVEFRGGIVPITVRSQILAPTQTDAATVETPPAGSHRGCDLTRPQGVPPSAIYRGTGVCQDEHDRPLPCSVFEGASARQPMAMRYFAYYEPDGTGIRQVDALAAGPNRHALEAELAFQLGQALASSGCCRDQARGYVAHAAGLFPGEPTYRVTLKALASMPRAETGATASDCAPGGTPALSASQINP